LHNRNRCEQCLAADRRQSLENDPTWADWSIAQLQAQSKVYRLAINPIIYSELSLTFSTVEALDQVLEGLGIQVMVDVPERIATHLNEPATTRDRP